MKQIIFTVILNIMTIICSAQAKQIDDANYLIAKQKLRQGDILGAYKNFLIFEYINFDRINLPINAIAKSQLEDQIRQLEDYLSQRVDITITKRSRGWADGHADSIMNAKQKKLMNSSTVISIK